MLPNKKLSIQELDEWIYSRIQGVFGRAEMEIMKEEIEKLVPGQIYLEIGVDEGRSFTIASHYAAEGVWIIGIDYIDPSARHQYMNIPLGHFPKGEGIISLGKTRAYIQSDAKMFFSLWNRPIQLLFIDGDHSYEGVMNDTLKWVPFVPKGGTVLYHDTDHPEVLRHLNDYYADGWELCGGKMGRIRI